MSRTSSIEAPASKSAAILRLVTELEKLQLNWDGYSSPPIQRAALETARRVVGALDVDELPAPFVCPVTGGGIGITWRTGGKELEIEILPNGTAEFSQVESNGKDSKVTREGELLLDNRELTREMLEWFLHG